MIRFLHKKTYSSRVYFDNHQQRVKWMPVIFILFLILIIAPQIYVRRTLSKFSKEIPSLPGTGGELAEHLIKRFNITDVKVEEATEGADHYDPENLRVRLSPSFINGKSISAIAVAAHEVGHAIQYQRQESIVELRRKFTPIAILCERYGQWLFLITPILFLLFKVPHAAIAPIIIALILGGISVLMQFIILPMEWDASFNKALPILVEGEYINEKQIPAVRRVLRAAALTYLAGAFINIINVWRILRVLR